MRQFIASLKCWLHCGFNLHKRGDVFNGKGETVCFGCEDCDTLYYVHPAYKGLVHSNPEYKDASK